MKKIYALFALLSIPFIGFTQQTINGTITHDDILREYILYVPADYDPTSPVPLVFNFHGYTSNNTQQMFYGDFRSIADTAGFIIVHPMGTEDLLGNTHWNVGWGSSNVNDVGFTEALIDSISVAYSINQDRIYSTGMSNGGFMSYQLACELSNRIAAIASVTGAMTINTPSSCSPVHPTPIMEIHGTADPTVPYDGNLLFESVESALSYWTNFNQTEASPIITDLDDVDPNDGSTVQHFFFDKGDNNVVVEHYKINNGAHTWPGTALNSPGTNHDINASKEIWRFFSTYDINGLINTTSTATALSDGPVMIYPNPSRANITIQRSTDRPATYLLTNVFGQPIQTGKFSDLKQQLNISALPAGLYLLHIDYQVIRVIKSE